MTPLHLSLMHWITSSVKSSQPVFLFRMMFLTFLGFFRTASKNYENLKMVEHRFFETNIPNGL